MAYEFLGGLLRQVAIAPRKVHTTDAKLTHLTVRYRAELVDFEYDVGNIGERRTHGHGFPGAQTLTAGVSTGLRGTVSIYDLPPAHCPGLHERIREDLARWHDISAQRVREI